MGYWNIVFLCNNYRTWEIATVYSLYAGYSYLGYIAYLYDNVYFAYSLQSSGPDIQKIRNIVDFLVSYEVKIVIYADTWLATMLRKFILLTTPGNCSTATERRNCVGLTHFPAFCVTHWPIVTHMGHVIDSSYMKVRQFDCKKCTQFLTRQLKVKTIESKWLIYFPQRCRTVRYGRLCTPPSVTVT